MTNQYQAAVLCSFTEIGFICMLIDLIHQVTMDFIAYEEHVAPLLNFF